ncbi:uncharacterized protein LOC105661935 [Megachile rotundata]|uniref:uncharacterized protein LOC105661935 n=1 Tax=Megachile rotundata TaxID=143995 RepID=UPI003FD58D53
MVSPRSAVCRVPSERSTGFSTLWIVPGKVSRGWTPRRRIVLVAGSARSSGSQLQEQSRHHRGGSRYNIPGPGHVKGQIISADHDAARHTTSCSTSNLPHDAEDSRKTPNSEHRASGRQHLPTASGLPSTSKDIPGAPVDYHHRPRHRQGPRIPVRRQESHHRGGGHHDIPGPGHAKGQIT